MTWIDGLNVHEGRNEIVPVHKGSFGHTVDNVAKDAVAQLFFPIDEAQQRVQESAGAPY